MNKILIFLAYFSISAALFSCEGKSGQEKTTEAEGDEHHDEHENENTASLNLEQMKSIGVELGKIENKQLTSSLRANGVLKVPNQSRATINSVYNGVIKSLLIQTGSTVKKGQVIATLSNPQFIQVQEEFLAINPKIQLAQQELIRQQELTSGNAGALKNLQIAESSLSELKTRRAALKEQIGLMGINTNTLASGNLISVISVRSPINGVVSNISVNLGNSVDVNTAVADVVDNSQLHLDLFVFEKDLSKLKKGQLIHFTLTNNPGKEYDAEIFSLGSSFEGESKAVSVHAKVKGDKTGLIDGMGITALISLEKAVAQAVPTDALVTYQGQDYIFIVSDAHAENEHHDESGEKHDHSAAEPHDHKEKEEAVAAKGITFERIPVAKGTTDVGYTEITPLKDIPVGSQIVVKGAFFILAKQTNTGGHEH
ncbi:efflux RND transporter periplasmic adaptor subunit [Chitinophaga cymbidii]|uniref:Secretion protein HlyD n=1 Tax=Chitinophaga cymbidii TaxID=1096750 RepID=A0A512RPX2_9BACT|nr:efflux RND transporter periplasmic adaptor subunit [Chitinophaga cymbidii]GEP97741.1 secretion protein HlyD [Chitinophaga cymbidii]